MTDDRCCFGPMTADVRDNRRRRQREERARSDERSHNTVLPAILLV